MERNAESINGGHVSREDGRMRMEKDAEGMGEGLEGSVKVKVTELLFGPDRWMSVMLNDESGVPSHR